MNAKRIRIEGQFFSTSAEAVASAKRRGGRAIKLSNGQRLAVSRAAAELLEQSRVEFAYLGECFRADGRAVICSVPVGG